VPVNTPMYFFISNDQESSAVGWSEVLIRYLSKISIGKHMKLDTNHYAHYEKADIIATEAKAFLEKIE